MSNNPTDKLRNVCLMSHGATGKTSLTEAMLFNAGASDRLGKVIDGNTATDYDPEEIKRKISISTSVAYCEWKGTKINIIDTPGYFDFVGEVREGVRASDACVIPVSAKSGNQAGVERAWSYAKEHNIPKIIFINKVDEPNTNFFNVLENLRGVFGKSLAPFMIPIISGESLMGYVNVVEMKAFECQKEKLVEIPIPNDLNDEIKKIHEMIVESVAESDEELLEKYLGGQEFTIAEVHKGLRVGILSGDIAPILCGSATMNIGIEILLDSIVDYFPAPQDRGVFIGEKPGTAEQKVERKPLSTESAAALVFKTIADPFVGKLSIFKVYSGTLKANSMIYNASQDKSEKIGQLMFLKGKKQIPTEKVEAGDIGAIPKLQFTLTGDTLCEQANAIILPRIEFPTPEIFLAVEPKTKGDEEKISSGLHRLMEEDLTIKLEVNTETHQHLLHGMGEQHLEVIVSKLKSKFQTDVNLVEPKIPYRETIKKKVKAEGKHKKQSGGHGQYGHVWIEFEPGPTEDLTFVETIFGGSVPRQYIPAVEKGLRESIPHGVLAGYPVVNLKANLVDGSYHDVDSSEMAFKIAANLAFKKALSEASPVLLEPIMRVEVFVPEHYMGDVIGDLNKRRGRIIGMNPIGDGLQKVEGEVPMAEMFKYSTDLRSMTQARGRFTLTFERYEETPPNISTKVAEEYKKSRQQEE